MESQLPLGQSQVPGKGAESEAVLVRAQVEERLFATPQGKVIYTHPRLMPRTQLAALEGVDDTAITVDEIAASDDSYVIESRPEYGASTFCRVLQLAIIQRGRKAVLRSARDLPKYRRKLEVEFGDAILKETPGSVLVLDDVDIERDERLLSELKEAGWFSRVVLVSVNRRLSESLASDLESLPFSPKVLFIWALGRDQIREFASQVLEANDLISEAKAVDKVYSDLLGLRIPLTPSNVLMYLKVLQREGDFEPLSSVDILSRYLSESLRRPSDVSSESFNAKNKMDVLSSFAFEMHSGEQSDFDERHWLNFCATYQSRTLSDFNSKDFLNELVESRIFGVYRGIMYFRYSFYFRFFLGRYLWPRPSQIRTFFESDDYLINSSVVDVITGLSSENSDVVGILSSKLERHLQEFAQKYVKTEFDPLLKAIWPNADDEEEEKLWQPVQTAIAQGPANSKEIDTLKTSMLAEARTSDQQVTYEKFTQLENALFAEAYMLADALKNVDDVDGSAKVKAWNLIVQSILVVLQVGTMFAPTLAKKKRVRWGGISFLNFDQAAAGLEDKPHEAFVSVVTSLVDAVVSKTSQDYGSAKLASVFRAAAGQSSQGGFIEVTNFACIATARGKGWFETLSTMIEKMDKNAFYLSEMLNQLLRILQYEIMPGRDREAMKRLVALIKAKRTFNKQAPGSKAVTKMVEHLEKEQFFPSPDEE